MSRVRAVTLALALGACGPGAPSGGHGGDAEPAVGAGAQAGARASGDVDPSAAIARVGATRIRAGEVVALARETGLSPREALERLVGEALLAGEASRRGYGARPDVVEATRRAAVRAWLAAEVERAVPASSISEAEIAGAYAAQGARFLHPEERLAVHVLVPLEAGASDARVEAARRLAEQARGELGTEGPEPVLARYAANPRALSGAFAVVAERVPGLVRGASFDPAFLEAVFALPGPGLVGATVRTQFGWHAIAVVGVRPDATIPLERARDVLRAERLAARRAERLEVLAAELGARTPPRVEPQAPARIAGIAVDDEADAPGGAR